MKKDGKYIEKREEASVLHKALDGRTRKREMIEWESNRERDQ